MSRAYKNKKFNTDNYTKYGVSPKYFGLQARRFPGSIKKQYCDEDRNGFADATFTKRRSEAVRKGTSCAQRTILNPDFGPKNLGFEVPKLGPLNLSQVKPVAGPLNLNSGVSASSFGPSSLSSAIVKPAAGPTNLLGEPQLIPDYGPTSLTSTTLPPGYGIVNITADIIEQFYVRFAVQHLSSVQARQAGGFKELGGSNMLPKLTLTNFPDPLVSVEQTETQSGYDIYGLPVGENIDYTVSNVTSPHRNSYQTVNDYPWRYGCSQSGVLRAFNKGWSNGGWIVNFQENGAYGYEPEWKDGYRTAIFNLINVDGVKTNATGNGIYRLADVITGTWRDTTYASTIKHRYQYTGCSNSQENLG